MSLEAKLTPISRVHEESDRIRVAIPFPSWVESHRIGMDVSRTERLMNWGGISSLQVIGDPDGQRTAVMPITVGSTRSGARFAGMGAAKESTSLESLQSNMDGNHRWAFRNAEWTSTKITLNLPEMQRMIDEKKGSLRKPESWTPNIDKALRRGIRKSGTEHLLTHFTPSQVLLNLWINVNNSLLSSAHLSIYDFLARAQPRVPDIRSLIFDTVFNFTFWSTMESFRYGIDTGKGTGYRISLFPGWEIDRAAGLQVLSRTQKLVRPIR